MKILVTGGGGRDRALAEIPWTSAPGRAPAMDGRPDACTMDRSLHEGSA